ncbi:hypothetical protein [Caulobacter radicis]|uniref:hypothetical protein n=1 Tax=Caulobacter radicis TaxID=2172650 RepID=UPI00140263B9|nr:hypothetical protein [Caulobacter radicis]
MADLGEDALMKQLDLARRDEGCGQGEGEQESHAVKLRLKSQAAQPWDNDVRE